MFVHDVQGLGCYGAALCLMAKIGLFSSMFHVINEGFHKKYIWSMIPTL